MEELGRLAEAAGATVVGRLVQERVSPTPALFLGRGKAEELKALAGESSATVIIFDDPLTPVQERNLSREAGVRVIDRTALILDIFAQRARTSEGKLQVELAQLSYLLPRLVGQWSHLERLGGGIGTRGPGETQLESDRRVIRRRIGQIHVALRDVQRHRRLLREHRRDVGLPVVALVGYTNAGKSTLLNRLAGAGTATADRLFVTLDPTARLVRGPGGGRFVLTDTVGFIQKLPTQLVAAFKATLEELGEADLLLHVVDASHPRAEEQMAAVESVLRALHLEERPILVALNKLDQVPEGSNGLIRALGLEGAVAMSARTGEGLSTLVRRVEGLLGSSRVSLRVRLPYDQGGLVASVYERGRVWAREDAADGIRLDVEVPRGLTGALAPYRVEAGPSEEPVEPEWADSASDRDGWRTEEARR
jgi:GTP-binding protein HflX